MDYGTDDRIAHQQSPDLLPSFTHMATPKSPKAITVPQLIEELKAAFPGTDEFPKMPIVESVLLAILRENHNLQDALKSMARFHSDFVDLNELRVSEIKEYQAIIGPLPDSEARGRAIRRFLREIFKHNYKFDIDGIAKKTFKEAKDELKHYDALKHDHHMAHVQVQTLGGHAFPVDHRVLLMAKRLGLVDQNADTSTLRGILEKNIPKAQILHAIALVERFVDSVCTQDEPKCPTCRFNSFCPGYQLILNPPKPQPEKKPAKPATTKPKPSREKSSKTAITPAVEQKSQNTAKTEPAKPVKSKPDATSPAPEAPKNKPEAKPTPKAAAPKAPAKPATAKVSATPAKPEPKPKSAAKPAPKAAAKPAAKPETKAAAKPASTDNKAKKPVPKKSK